MDNQQAIEEIVGSLGKVIALLGGASLEMHKLSYRQAKVAADLLRLCAARLDEIVDQGRDYE